MYAHSDVVAPPNNSPAHSQAVADSDVVFGFPGRESGLFGTFFELVVGAGGRLFTDDGRPSIDSPAAVAAQTHGFDGQVKQIARI